MRTWIIFHCPKDDCIVVSKLEGHVATGVAECPDMRTAEAMMEAMAVRDASKASSSAENALLRAELERIAEWGTGPCASHKA